MLILLQFSAKEHIMFDLQRGKIFDSLLEVFQEVLSDICSISFSLEYNFTVSQNFLGDCDIITCYIMYHLINSRGLAALKNISGKEVKKIQNPNYKFQYLNNKFILC